MRTVFAVGALVAALSWVAWWTWDEGSDPAGSGASVEEINGIETLRLKGTPKEKGEAHGSLFRESIRGWLIRLRPPDPGMADFAIETCGERLAPFLPDGYRSEIEGIALGAGITFHEALFLNTRFELAAFDLVKGARSNCGAAVGPGPAAGRLFRADEDLVVIIHEDVDPPLVLVTLPGMAGGFLGARGDRVAALCPAHASMTPSLNGLVWSLMLRRLLEEEVRDTLPARGTGPASVVMVRTDGAAGTLNFGPAGAAWYPGGAWSMTTAEPGGDGGLSILLGTRDVERRGQEAARARRLLGGKDLPAGAALWRLGGGRVSVFGPQGARSTPLR